MIYWKAVLVHWLLVVIVITALTLQARENVEHVNVEGQADFVMKHSINSVAISRDKPKLEL